MGELAASDIGCGTVRRIRTAPYFPRPAAPPHQSPFLPHQPEGTRDSARSALHQFQRARSERGRPSLITRRPSLITGRISRLSLR